MSPIKTLSKAIKLASACVDVRILPAAAIHIHWLRQFPKVSLTPDQNVFEFTPNPSILGTFINRFSEIFHNPNTLLGPFLKIRSPEAARQFLSATGCFLWPQFKRDEKGFNSTTLTWAEFERWQELIQRISVDGFLYIVDDQVNYSDGLRIGQTVPPSIGQMIIAAPLTTKAFLQGFPPMEREDDRLRKNRNLILTMNVNPSSTIEAVLACLYADMLSGFKRKRCERKGCNQVFVERSGKHYCSQKCAHHAGITRQRDKKKKEKKGKAKLNG